MAMTEYTKDAGAVLDYAWNWATWLDTDEIASHTVTVPTGLTLDSSTNTATAVTAWLSGGTEGSDYTVACEIVTDAGRTDERSVIIKVRQR